MEVVDPGNERSSSDIISECHGLYILFETSSLVADPRDDIPRRAHTGNLVYQKAAQGVFRFF